MRASQSKANTTWLLHFIMNENSEQKRRRGEKWRQRRSSLLFFSSSSSTRRVVSSCFVCCVCLPLSRIPLCALISTLCAEWGEEVEKPPTETCSSRLLQMKTNCTGDSCTFYTFFSACVSTPFDVDVMKTKRWKGAWLCVSDRSWPIYLALHCIYGWWTNVWNVWQLPPKLRRHRLHSRLSIIRQEKCNYARKMHAKLMGNRRVHLWRSCQPQLWLASIFPRLLTQLTFSQVILIALPSETIKFFAHLQRGNFRSSEL